MASPRLSKAKPQTILLVLVVAVGLHGLLLGYPFWRLGQWLELPEAILALMVVVILLSQLLCRWPLRQVRSTLARSIKQLLEVPLAVSPILLLLVLAAEGGLALVWVDRSDVGFMILGVLGCVLPVGAFIAWRPVIKTLSLQNPKLAKALHIVQITDVHIGSRSPRFLTRLVKKINKIDPEALMITGDFIDQTGIDARALAPLKTLSMPVFFVIGNHERYEDLEAILAGVKACGVNVLRNRGVSLRDDVQIVGVDDSDDPTQLKRVLPGIDMPNRGFKVLLYHRPTGLEAAAERGFDLTLSGHTHNGQVFPFNVLVKRQFPKIKGLYRTYDCDHYVSPGTGTWGPVFRLGSLSEITSIHITPG